jgi:thiosulfate dehydrogenase
MFKFLLGFLTALLVVAVAAFSYVRLGFVDPRADVPTGQLEQRIAMPSLDASVDRRAPEIANPLDASDANLIAGMNVYQANCAVCHGDVSHPQAILADALYPRVPQFLDDAPDMPENQNYYIIQHGIRLSGMPAWKQSLSDQQIWQVTTFLSHIHKLPPLISEQWKAAAGPAAAVAAPPNSPAMDKNMHMK